jgi:hypothetical protein
MQNGFLRTTGNVPRCTPVRDLHTAFSLPCVCDYMIELCRSQAESCKIMRMNFGELQSWPGRYGGERNMSLPGNETRPLSCRQGARYSYVLVRGLFCHAVRIQVVYSVEGHGCGLIQVLFRYFYGGTDETTKDVSQTGLETNPFLLEA